MRYRQLGSSDLVVSEIALGTWLTFGGGISGPTAREIVDDGVRARDQPDRHRQRLQRGAAESLLGEVLASRPRDSYVLATKLYFPMSDEDRGLSRDAGLQAARRVAVGACGRTSSTSTSATATTPRRRSRRRWRRSARSSAQGKARYIGFSEWTPGQIQAALELPGVERFVSSQPEYSLFHRAPEEGVIELCAASGISQIVFSPLAQGVLTGKYPADRQRRPTTRARVRERMGWAMGRYLAPEILAAVDRLRPIADGLGLTLAQLAIAWVLREPNVAAALVGASRPEHLRENAAASGVDLDAATLARDRAGARGSP